MARPRRAHALLAALTVGMIITGCAGVPDHSAVHAGNPVPADNTVPEEQVRVLVHGPRPGDNPDNIVSGFLTASAGSDTNHDIARQYLTSDAGRKWQPDKGASVYAGSATDGIDPPRVLKGARSVRFHVQLAATIDIYGGYKVAAPKALPLQVNFRLVSEHGEWRIANPPNGLLLSTENVGRSLSAQFVYFLNRDLHVLVPNTVFLPVTGAGLTTALMRALLRGPTPWLAPAVRTAVPAGTSLLGPVPVDHGTAIVDLSQEVLALNPTQRAQLSAQVVWTLSGVPTVTRVRVLVDGNPLNAQAAAGQSRDDWPTYDPAALAAGAQGFYRLGSRIVTVSGGRLPGPVGATPSTLTDVALSPDLAFVGGLRRSGTRTVAYAGSVGTEPRQVYVADYPLTAPSWDTSQTGEMWTVELSPTTRVLLIRPGQPVLRVPSPELNGVVVRELRISRDGTRVAVIASASGVGELLVGRVATTSDGALRIDGLHNPAAGVITDVSHASWADGNTVAVLARSTASGARVPYLVDVDGVKPIPVTTSGLTSYVALAAAPGQPTLVESTDGGRTFIYQASKGVWTPVGEGSDPAYPG